jgi:alanine racemase
MTHPLAWAEISLKALRHNYQLLHNCSAANCKTMAVIKADGYGHGAVECAKALSSICDTFAVSRIEEAITLRENGIDANFLVLSGINTEHFRLCQQYKLQPVIHTIETLEALVKSKASVSFWLKFNSGMHRLGIASAEAEKVRQILETLDTLNTLNTNQPTLAGVLSHLSNADDVKSVKNSQQIEAFTQIKNQIKSPCYSLANSAALIFNPSTHFNFSRPGIALYGANPCTTSSEENRTTEALQAVMRLKATVIALQQLETGDAVGYSERWRAAKPSTLATVSIGYADGYPRHAPNGTPVFIRGKRYPLVGTVSMDLISVDVTASDVAVGDEVELWGDNIAVTEVADKAATISYELLTKVTPRVTRVYSND